MACSAAWIQRALCCAAPSQSRLGTLPTSAFSFAGSRDLAEALPSLHDSDQWNWLAIPSATLRAISSTAHYVVVTNATDRTRPRRVMCPIIWSIGNISLGCLRCRHDATKLAVVRQCGRGIPSLSPNETRNLRDLAVNSIGRSVLPCIPKPKEILTW